MALKFFYATARTVLTDTFFRRLSIMEDLFRVRFVKRAVSVELLIQTPGDICSWYTITECSGLVRARKSSAVTR